MVPPREYSMLVDPNLSLTVLDAATELDNHLGGAATSFDATHRLGEVLRHSIRRRPDGRDEQLANPAFVAPTMAGLYHHAFERLGQTGTDKVATLVEQTSELADKLSAADGTLSAEHTRRLRNFCVVLTESLFGNLDLNLDPPLAESNGQPRVA